MSCHSEALRCLPKMTNEDSGVKGHLKVIFSFVYNFCHIYMILFKFDIGNVISFQESLLFGRSAGGNRFRGQGHSKVKFKFVCNYCHIHMSD